jgi:hypothetical protein
MFTDIKTDSAQRITEVRESLTFISGLLPAPPTAAPRHLETAKGLIFVQLYGAIEFTILKTVSRTIFLINGEKIKLQDIKTILLGMALHPELDALKDVSSKKWVKRKELFQKLEDNNEAEMLDVMPTDGRNFDDERLRSIWETFCIADPLFHDPSFRLRLKDIVAHRVNIAHGNISAADVGSTMAYADLETRINETSDFCSYFISVFEDYISNDKYMK